MISDFSSKALPSVEEIRRLNFKPCVYLQSANSFLVTAEYNFAKVYAISAIFQANKYLKTMDNSLQEIGASSLLKKAFFASEGTEEIIRDAFGILFFCEDNE